MNELTLAEVKTLTLASPQLRELSRVWTWRDRSGEFHRPERMETSHLFHVVSMIWNHTMPSEAHTHEFRKYRFGSFYNERYMQVGARILLRELMNRKDREEYMNARLQFMANYINGRAQERISP